MNILLTAISLVTLIGCFLAYTRTQREADGACDQAMAAQAFAASLKSERARIHDVEREIESLRRELRKLSGKFYAAQREQEIADEVAYEFDPDPNDGRSGLRRFGVEIAEPYCDNWALAQREGPQSEAAKCACRFCTAARARRARLRGELVPRTVQGQAELARLNAGKP